MTDPLALGVDIGGTKIGFTLIDRQGHVSATLREPTRPAEGPEAAMDRIVNGIRSLLAMTSQPVAGIGIGCPGYVDPVSGVVRQASNLGWGEVALRAGILQRLGDPYPIWLGIDADANALGEWYFGAARGSQDFVYVTIGTGLGGSAVVGGRLLAGANGYAMEIGHVQLDAGGRLCPCGLRGCPEMYVSGIGLQTGVREHAPAYPDSALAQVANPSTEQILTAARAQDGLALAVIIEAREWLFRTLAYCTSLFNPGLVVIGGGLGLAASDFFIHDAKEQIMRRTLPMSHRSLSVRASQVNNSAIGAACLVWHGMEKGQE